MKGRGIFGGKAEGYVLHADPLSFLGGVDENGIVIDRKNRAYGKSIKKKILAFPHGIGSTVGSYVLYGLKKRGCGPAAIINESAEPIVVVGAVISDIPIVDGIEIERLSDEDYVRVDGEKGIVEKRKEKKK
jgi:predicted aconitase with swiveling domain